MLRGSSVIGLDIGSHQIKAVYLERKRGGWHLVAAGVQPTPPEAVQEGIVVQRPEVAAAIQGLLRRCDIPSGDTIAAVSGATVTVRQVKVPDMPEASLKKSIRFEAAKYMPSVQDSALEYAVLGKSGDPPQLDLLLVAAPLDMVNSRVETIELAGLEPIAVDIEAFALLRAIAAADLGVSLDEPVAVVNVGATFTDVNIVHRECLAVTRSIPIGGNALTQSIASAANVPVDEAESLKRLIDVSWPDARFTDGPIPGGWMGQPTPVEEVPGLRQALQVTYPFLEEILREVRRSVNYFQSQFPEGCGESVIGRLIVTGGTARLTGLASFLEAKLSLPVTVLDLFSDHVRVGGLHVAAPSLDQLQPCSIDLAVATGLALKE
jgi:type IV pilus assembly protein PilM